MNTKIQATKAAENLCRRLGEGWVPHIWENLGWHFKAVNGYINVSEAIIYNPEHSRYPVYYDARLEPKETIYFNEGLMGFGVQIFAKGETPKEAVANVLIRRDEVCTELMRIVDKLKAVEA